MAGDTAVASPGPAPGEPGASAEQGFLAAAAEQVSTLLAGERQPEGLDASGLIRRYYDHVPVEDLAEHTAAELAAAVVAHLDVAARRHRGQARVRVLTPADGTAAWSAARSVVQVVTDDMPFLVDSVTAAVSQAGYALHRVLHPRLWVRRSDDGMLQGGSEAGADGGILESWIHLEIDRVPDLDEAADLESRLMRVLADVRAAVDDWQAMRSRAEEIAAELDAAAPTGIEDAEAHESAELLRWLADDRFTFLGYREYALTTLDGGEPCLESRTETGLGVLRGERRSTRSFASLPPAVRHRAVERRLLVLTQANSRSTVHRPAYLDYVGIKTFDAEGNVTGERRFLGLYTSSAVNESVRRVPVVRRTVDAVMARAGATLDSHDGRSLLAILETYPRAELFQTNPDQLYDVVTGVLELQERRRTRLFVRRDPYERFVSCLVYFPRDRFTTDVRLRLMELLREAYGGVTVDYSARLTESVLARLHIVVRVDQGAPLPEADVAALEQRLEGAVRTWGDDFAEGSARSLGETEASALLRRWADAFPAGYQERTSPATALTHVRQAEALAEGTDGTALAVNWGDSPAVSGTATLTVITRGQPLSLAQLLPVLARLGVEVVEELPSTLTPRDGPPVNVYVFGLRHTAATTYPDTAERVGDAFTAVWQGRAESDGLGALVLHAGLTWQQVVVLRAYVRYLRQIGSTFGQEYVESVMLAHPRLARALVTLFKSRFDPAGPPEGAPSEAEQVEAFERALDDVASLDADRILRSLLGLVRATVRTTTFQHDGSGRMKPYLAVKLDPQRVPDLPEPRPAHEIWVYSPRIEGVHLRFGAVARGGLRWSDRREDFRTEVLGLVKAQQVKNAVIVPVGAKGGFCPKRLPDPNVDREAWLAEGKACYRQFISALLDLTDNRVDGAIVPPPDTVRLDGDDPYLVVAADKGTATFSDMANALAVDRGFWLGDAFASGGSAGYDHKEMGITARGAWESVKRHFRELGVDTQQQDFTVVGIGDMSGDVFGNGMLLSRHIRLVAAFDHRHVFVDPTPDPATSYDERHRLASLARSSWGDYDTSLLSPGGGVWPRSVKRIELTPELRAALGIDEAVGALTPAELVHAILLAPVDLLWNGGIGTYVKAASETHPMVGDKANDTVRVDGEQLRVKVVGEGGNLGLTQRGRIEAALSGVRLNTDAVDNSAGVDTSDHEVNLKILLDHLLTTGDVRAADRDAVLQGMTDDVAHRVLRDNYLQNVLLGTARAQAPSMLSVHQRLIRDLEARGELDRELEALPRDAEIEARSSLGHGLTSPELSVLMAYAKLTLAHDVAESPLPDEGWAAAALRAYVPERLRLLAGARILEHPLRREIITTALVNRLVNRGGITYVFRTTEETGANPAEVVRAFAVVARVFDLDDVWARIEALDNVVPTTAQTALSLECRRLLDRSVRWLLQERRSAVDVGAEIEHFAAVRELSPHVVGWLRGAERERWERRTTELETLGAPADLAGEVAALLDVFSLLDIVEIAAASKERPETVGELYFALSERFEVDAILGRITALPRGDRWSALARMSLRYDLYGALAALTRSVQAAAPDADRGPAARIAAWEAANAEGLARARATLHEISSGESFDLATLSVALRTIRTLVP